MSRLKSWKLVVVILVIILAGSIGAWTVTSPTVMQVQSAAMLSNSIFNYVKQVQRFNFTDGGGFYTFQFGLAYNENSTPGQPIIVDVYSSLVGITIHSGFQKGVALRLQHASVLVDNRADNGIKVRTTYSPQVASFYLSFIDMNSSSAQHTITIRLILNLVDVNYVGYLTGSTELIVLNATVTLL